jgi:hypothetical protein
MTVGAARKEAEASQRQFVAAATASAADPTLGKRAARITVAALLFCALASVAHGDNYTNLHWSIDRTVTPNRAAVNSADGTQRFDIFTLTAAGAPTPLFANTFCSASQWITASSGVPLCAQPAFSDISGTAAVAQGGTGSTTFTANLPLVGNGTGALAQGTRSGNSTQYVTTTGAQTANDCVKIDANGNHIANGSACGLSGTVPIASGGTGQTTQQAAINALTGTQTNKFYLRSNGTNSLLTDLLAADLKGTTTNDSATAGYLGEYISSSIEVGSAVSFAVSGTAYNITSVSLTAGNWHCTGMVSDNPAAGTTTTYVSGAISTTSATIPTIPNAGGWGQWAGSVDGNISKTASFAKRVPLASTTTVYLVGQAGFSGSTNSGFGFIGCERHR